jgi:hypothetical protein
MLWVIGGALESFSIQSCMLLFMKAVGRYSVPQNNTYPLGITAIGKNPRLWIMTSLIRRYHVYASYRDFDRCDRAALAMGSRRVWSTGCRLYPAPHLESPNIGQARSIL